MGRETKPARRNPSRGPRAKPAAPAPAVVVQSAMVIEVRERAGAGAKRADGHADAVAAAQAVHDRIAEAGGKVDCILGSRVVASFTGRAVARALDAAVTLLQEPVSGTRPSTHDFAVGLASGRVLQASACDALGLAVLGSAVDRALLLASWSEPGTIAADELTVTASDSAEADDRRWRLGSSRVLVGRETEPVEYWQVLFGPAPGEPPPAVESPRRLLSGAQREQLEALVEPVRAAPTTPAAPVWSRGVVRYWNPPKGRGVIGSVTAQEFYVDKRFFVVPAVVDEGNVVFFVPRDPIMGGRNPVASLVLLEGARVEVRVDALDAEGWGVTELRDGSSARTHIALDLTRLDPVVRPVVGEWLVVDVVERDGVPVGVAA